MQCAGGDVSGPDVDLRECDNKQRIPTMRYLPALLLLAAMAAAQTPCTSKRTESGDTTIDCSGVNAAPTRQSAVSSAGIDLATYTILLVPQQGEGYMVAIDKEQKLAFI